MRNELELILRQPRKFLVKKVKAFSDVTVLEFRECACWTCLKSILMFFKPPLRKFYEHSLFIAFNHSGHTETQASDNVTQNSFNLLLG